MKNPRISAVLNFLFWGVGYVYNGKRVGFGISLFIVWVLMFFTGYLLLTPQEITGGVYYVYFLPVYPLSFANFILSVALAYDGYNEAKEI